MKMITYKDVPSNCIFLAPVEWNYIEMDLPISKRAEYGAKGYPSIELPNGRYSYLPVKIGNHGYRLIAGSRPVERIEHA